MKQPYDTQIGRQVLTRNLDQPNTVVADKGYDWDALRQQLRGAGVRPVIKYREFYALDKVHNTRYDEDTYQRCSLIEAIFYGLKRRSVETLRARTWFGQFRGFVLKTAVSHS